MNDSANKTPALGVGSASFIGLLITQGLGAINDNMFRWYVVNLASAQFDHPEPILSQEVALSLGLASFTIPYLIFATFAGFLADRFSKRKVIVGCKIAEIVLMAAGIFGVMIGNVYFLFAIVFLMGTQSALFGPAKFGSIPELVRDDQISTANGFMGLVTVVASAIGTFAGYLLFDISPTDLRNPGGLSDVWLPTTALIATAAVGWLASLLIARLVPAAPDRKPPLNPIPETYRNLHLLFSNRPLLRTSLGIAFFWFLASIANMNINTYGEEVLGLTKTEIGGVMVVLVLGVGIGSVLAGIWSGGKVELGLVPLGAFGVSVSSMLLFYAGSQVDPGLAASQQDAYWWSNLWLFALGLSAGLFNVPLESYMQHRSDPNARGVILAANNFVAFTFMLAASGLFYLMQGPLGLSSSEIFLVAGLGTVPVIVYAFGVLPQATIRFIVWLASMTIYRIRVHGRENVPKEGGALIVANHVSWLDGILMTMMSDRPIRMLAYSDYIDGPGIGWLTRTFGVIGIKAEDGPKAIMRSLKTAQKAVANGELVGIFAEGQITRTGQLQPFQRGMTRIVDKTGAPIIPCYLDELWGSIFSFQGGRFFWKWPKKWPYPISILFGKPVANTKDVFAVRQAVEQLGVDAVEKRAARTMSPPRLFLRRCKSALFRKKVADSSGQELTGGKLLTGTLVFKRLLEKHVVAPDEKMVGVLLPPSVGGTLANTSLAISGRVAVNLNYTLSDKDVNFCIDHCGIKHVLTSRRFMEKKPIELNAEPIFLEDLKEKISGADKICSLLESFLLPASILERKLGLTKSQPDDLMTVIFTSGSTGNPKGVMLSHKNVGANIASADQLFNINEKDMLLGVLPFFHSFGYTLMMWLPLTTDASAVYHFNPLDGRQIGKLCEKHDVTIVAATPTFLKTYLKRCEKEQMKSLDLAIVGAEKLPHSLGEAFEEKFGVYPTEGFGATELSPLAIANVPAHRCKSDTQAGTKLGTVGRAIPNVIAKVVDVDTGEDLGADTQGLLKIKGPNVMLGYLHEEEKTAEAIEDGWYNTGDLAKIDEDGFVEITGRLSRFSKIGGEMVPHIKIEAELTRIVDNPNAEEPEIRVAVTSVPDEKKGERLIVVHKKLEKTIDQIREELANAEFPNLWIPSADSFLEVEEIPLLGTGKLDLRGLKQTAEHEFSA